MNVFKHLHLPAMPGLEGQSRKMLWRMLKPNHTAERGGAWCPERGRASEDRMLPGATQPTAILAAPQPCTVYG